MIWDTVIHPDQTPAKLARATTLFVGNQGPFYTRHINPYEQSSLTNPKLVATMLGDDASSGSGWLMVALVGGITIGIFAATLLMHPKRS